MATMGKRILVVDDDPGVRLFLKMCLEQYGCSVETAVTGNDALDLLRRAAFDGMLLDYVMPGGMDGLAVLVQSRRLYPAMPVIMMTGYNGRELESLVLAAGAQRCLHKPFDFAELECVVRQWVQAAA